MTRHLTWPADRAYWAILDTTLLPRRRRRSPEHCGYLLEAELPVPIDDVHAVYTPVGSDRMLACAVDRAAVAQVVTPSTRTLIPDGVPEGILEDGARHARRLNLLTGSLEPAAVRRVRRQSAIAAGLVVVAASALLTLGLERRSRALDVERRAMQADVSQMLSVAVGRDLREDTAATAMAQRELEGSVERLRRTRDQQTAEREVFDAAAVLASVLNAWPDEPVQVRSLTVAQEAINIEGTTADPLVPPRVTAALDGLADWKARLAENTQQRDAWTVKWRLQRIKGATHQVAGGRP